MAGQRASEEELLERLRHSNSGEDRRNLLEDLLTPYLNHIARWALRISANRDEAAEIAQDALLAVCAHIDQFRGRCRFSTWVYTIVRNHGWKRASRLARDSEIPLDEAPEPRAEEPEADERVETRERIEQLRRLIDSELTPLEARIFLRHFGEGISLAVLARELGLTNRSGARAYLTAARRKLRRKMRFWELRPPSPRAIAVRGLVGIKGGDDD